jgi:prolyl 4-hydroxylase
VEAASRAEIESRAASGDSRAQLELASLLDKAGDVDEARVWLERAVAAGDPLGATLLAEVLLSRTPYDVPRGLALVGEAVKAGDARATHLAALLAAAGVGQAQNLKRALDLLSQAAQGGWNLAQETVACTSSKLSLAASALRTRSSEPGLWRRLAEGIDLAPFFQTPPTSIISESPRIAAVRGFLPPGICRWLIARARPSLIPAEVYDRDTGRLIVDSNRNNRAALFPLVLSDLILLLVRERIARVIGRPTSFMEQPGILNYAPGEEYRPHFDFCDVSLPGPAKDAAENGQRVLTFLIYLNDDYEGGETDFPRLSWHFRGHAGDALFWWSVDTEGNADLRTLHAGLPTRKGEKWLFSQWVRDRPEMLYR